MIYIKPIGSPDLPSIGGNTIFSDLLIMQNNNENVVTNDMEWKVKLTKLLVTSFSTAVAATAVQKSEVIYVYIICCIILADSSLPKIRTNCSAILKSGAHSLAFSIDCGPLTITSAAYGGNCGATIDNLLSNSKDTCDDHSSCSCTMDITITGDLIWFTLSVMIE